MTCGCLRDRALRAVWVRTAVPVMLHGVADPCGSETLGYGVIGSPTDSGSVSLGSSPGTPADRLDHPSTRCPILAIWCPSARSGTVPIRWRATLTSGSKQRTAPLCSGLARRPLKAVARVRIPSGLRETKARHLTVAGLRAAWCQGVPRRSASVSRAAAVMTAPACRRPGARPSRSIGPLTDTAATTRLPGPRTGADTDTTPGSRSLML